MPCWEPLEPRSTNKTDSIFRVVCAVLNHFNDNDVRLIQCRIQNGCWKLLLSSVPAMSYPNSTPKPFQTQTKPRLLQEAPCNFKQKLHVVSCLDRKTFLKPQLSNHGSLPAQELEQAQQVEQEPPMNHQEPWGPQCFGTHVIMDDGTPRVYCANLC